MASLNEKKDNAIDFGYWSFQHNRQTFYVMPTREDPRSIDRRPNALALLEKYVHWIDINTNAKTPHEVHGVLLGEYSLILDGFGGANRLVYFVIAYDNETKSVGIVGIRIVKPSGVLSDSSLPLQKMLKGAFYCGGVTGIHYPKGSKLPSGKMATARKSIIQRFSTDAAENDPANKRAGMFSDTTLKTARDFYLRTPHGKRIEMFAKEIHYSEHAAKKIFQAMHEKYPDLKATKRNAK